MKKIVIASLSNLAFATSAYASQQTAGVYIAGELSASIISMHDAKIITRNDGEILKVNNKNKDVFGSGIAVGYDFDDLYELPLKVELVTTLRGEAKKTYDYTDIIKINNKVRMDTYMVNGYYGLCTSNNFTPYISAGLGLSHLKHKISASVDHYDAGSVSSSSNNFAWGVGVGVKYAINSNIAVDASYRYVDGGKVSGSESDGIDATKAQTKATSKDLMLGVAYKF